ncbi:MAG: hypothetical protein JEZ04_22510 [Spirochaetales bacterium]|nr:hypothetical protein [Spirochaetales bacterium]
MQSVLSVDLGTTAVKVSLVRRDGNILFTTAENYPSDLSGGRVEQDPEDWWRALKTAITEIMMKYHAVSFEAVVLSGQMQDLICISDGKLSGRAILYSDTRAAEQWNYISNKMGAEAFAAAVMNSGDSSIIPAKILWLKKYSPELFSSSVLFLLGAHDYICWKLTGLAVTDYTNASATGMLNFSLNKWDSDILSIAGVTEENLPVLTRADRITGEVTPSAAAETGLPAGLPVVHGAGDAASSTIGAGAGVEGIYSGYLGTSGWIAASSGRPAKPETGIFNLKHPDPEKVLNIGPMLLTGGNIEWAVKTLLSETGEDVSEALFDSFSSASETSPPGCGGIFYMPHLAGERAPFRDPDARGAFIGLSKSSTREDMFRAVLEGVSYSLRSIIEMIETKSPESRIIHLSGGGAENRLWAEILSSVTGAEIYTMADARESGVLGNVIIAGNALGWIDGFSAPAGFIAVERRYEPDEKLSAFYNDGYRIYKKLYPALKNTFRDISSWNKY